MFDEMLCIPRFYNSAGTMACRPVLTDNTNEEVDIVDNIEQETLKLNALNKLFGWIEDKQTKSILVNKYYNNKQHRLALRAFLDDMIKAIDESTSTLESNKNSSGKEETKRQLSYVK